MYYMTPIRYDLGDNPELAVNYKFIAHQFLNYLINDAKFNKITVNSRSVILEDGTRIYASIGPGINYVKIDTRIQEEGEEESLVTLLGSFLFVPHNTACPAGWGVPYVVDDVEIFPGTCGGATPQMAYREGDLDREAEEGTLATFLPGTPGMHAYHNNVVEINGNHYTAGCNIPRYANPFYIHSPDLLRRSYHLGNAAYSVTSPRYHLGQDRLGKIAYVYTGVVQYYHEYNPEFGERSGIAYLDVVFTQDDPVQPSRNGFAVRVYTEDHTVHDLLRVNDQSVHTLTGDASKPRHSMVADSTGMRLICLGSHKDDGAACLLDLQYTTSNDPYLPERPLPTFKSYDVTLLPPSTSTFSETVTDTATISASFIPSGNDPIGNYAGYFFNSDCSYILSTGGRDWLGYLLYLESTGVVIPPEQMHYAEQEDNFILVNSLCTPSYIRIGTIADKYGYIMGYGLYDAMEADDPGFLNRCKTLTGYAQFSYQPRYCGAYLPQEEFYLPTGIAAIGYVPFRDDNVLCIRFSGISDLCHSYYGSNIETSGEYTTTTTRSNDTRLYYAAGFDKSDNVVYARQESSGSSVKVASCGGLSSYVEGPAESKYYIGDTVVSDYVALEAIQAADCALDGSGVVQCFTDGTYRPVILDIANMCYLIRTEHRRTRTYYTNPEAFEGLVSSEHKVGLDLHILGKVYNLYYAEFNSLDVDNGLFPNVS